MAYEFTVGDRKYRAGRLNAFDQSHIVRRIAPLMSAFAGTVEQIKADPGNAFGPLAQAFAGMTDADVEYIQKKALAVVETEQAPEKWAPVMARSGVLMFDDIGMLEMNQIVFEVLKDALTPFFTGLGRMGLGSLLQSMA